MVTPVLGEQSWVPLPGTSSIEVVQGQMQMHELCVGCLQAPLKRLGLVFLHGETKTFFIAANVGEGLKPSRGTGLKPISVDQ